MAGRRLLAESLVQTDGAGHRDIQGPDHAYLGYYKITVCESPDFFTYAIVFVPKYQCDRLAEIDVVQRNGG